MFVRRFLAIGGLTCGVAVWLLASSTANAAWFGIDWWDRNELIFDNSAGGENLTDFPVLVQLSSSNFDFSRAQANGQDVRFTTADGTTQLAHEIEHWDQAGQQASVWVNVPSITAGSSADKIYIYSANQTASDGQNMTGTWNSDFHMVQHLQETTGTHEDSTSYDNDGTWIAPVKPTNPATQDATGKIAGANLFWGIGTHPNDPSVNDKTRIDVAYDSSIRGNSSITVEAWYMQQEDVAGEDTIVRTDGEWMLSLASGTSSTAIRFGRAGTGWGSPSVIWSSNKPTMNEWHYAVGTADWDGSKTILDLYVDGVLVGTTGPGGIADTLNFAGSSPIRIGARNDAYGPNFFHGLIDEVRYSAAAQSADWIEAQYLSMTDQFVTFGATYTVPEPAGALLLVFGWLFLATPRRSRRRQSS